MIDLENWNLTIPEGTPARVIETSRLVNGYSDKYFRPGETLFFWAPVTGSSTSKSEFPRSELRETFKDGKLRNWTYPEADHRLQARLTVEKVPSSGRIVIGQIHRYQDDGPLLKVEYLYDHSRRTGRVVAKYRLKPQSDDSEVVVAEDVDLQEKFSYDVRLSSAGYLNVASQDAEWGRQLSTSWKNKKLYFKAGAYTLDNTGYSTEGSRVIFERLSVRHTTR
jgi:hypothetical protein